MSVSRGIGLNQQLLGAIEAASVALERSGDGHLPFQYRLGLLKGVTAWGDGKEGKSARARGHLAILIGTRVSVLLPMDWPCSDSWKEERAKALSCLKNIVKYPVTPSEIMWTDCDDWVASRGVEAYLAAGGYCCARALRSVAVDVDYFDDPRVGGRFELVQTEVDLDPWTYDTALLGSIAAGKGWPGETGENVNG
jgi:hypothetical protein